jgi:hypothetical protein
MWETLAKSNKHIGRFHRRDDRPFVQITKRGILFNRMFMDTFEFRNKQCIVVLFDSVNDRLGFRVAKTSADQDAGYKLTELGTSGKTSIIVCDSVIKKLGPKYLDKYFMASLPTGSTIITIKLLEPHICEVK